MDERRADLRGTLERHYRGCGWKVERAADGTVRARGPGGVTWIGVAVVADDLAAAAFDEFLLELSEQRMPTGELCPLELLPAEECAVDLEARLRRLRLLDRGHIALYSLAA